MPCNLWGIKGMYKIKQEMYLGERTSQYGSKSRYDYTYTTHIRLYLIITILYGLEYIGMD
jgi:hypothetical protein